MSHLPDTSQKAGWVVAGSQLVHRGCRERVRESPNKSSAVVKYTFTT